MSNNPRGTDERLRSWLDANQLDRERLCQAILALDHRFRDVRPRHPRGGRDAGRDLEARLADGREVWGAIGFRNSASDSDADRRWVTKKFREDLRRAKEARPELPGFVFLTNVELRVSERERLQSWARNAGVEFADVFHRERLRIILDSPDGLAARYQYLGITLSDAEQAAFFARWGNELEELVSRGFAAVDRQLGRLEFLQACLRPLRSVGLYLTLRQPVSPATLGHFRAILAVWDIDGRAPFAELILGFRSHSEHRIDREGTLSCGLWVEPRPRAGTSEIAPTEADAGQEQRIACLIFQEVLSNPASVIGRASSIPGWLGDAIALPLLGDLDGTFMSVFVTEPLVKHIGEVIVTAGEYTLLRVPEHEIRFHSGDDEQLRDLWPNRLTAEEAAVRWFRLDDSRLDFSVWTPPRLYGVQ